MMQPIEYFSLDNIIVYGFIIIIVLLGVNSYFNNKNIIIQQTKDNRIKSNLFFLSLFIKNICGSYLIGVSEYIYRDGIIGTLILLGTIFGSIITSFVTISRLSSNKNFKGNILNFLEFYYGEKAKFFCSLITYVFSVSLICIQILAISIVTETIFNTTKTFSLIIASAIIFIYYFLNSYNSIDISRTILIIFVLVIFPVVANTIVNKSGGLNTLLGKIHPNNFFIYKHSKFSFYILLFTLNLFSISKLSFENMSFLLSESDIKKAKKVYLIDAMLLSALLILVSLISFATISKKITISPNTLIPYAINNYVPSVLKGISISGLLLLFISYANKNLKHSVDIICNNIILPLTNKVNLKIEISKFYKIFALLNISLGLLIASFFSDLILIRMYALGLIVSFVGIPFLFVLLRIKVDKQTFYISTSLTLIGFIFSFLFLTLTYKFYSIIISIILNVFSMLIFHIIKNKKILFESQNTTEKKHINYIYIKKSIIKLLNNIINITDSLKDSFRIYGSNHVLFGTFFCIFYLVPVFMWIYGETPHNNLIIFLRTLGGLLSIGLILEKKWYWELKKYFPLYWYFTITYCLPFLSTCMYMLMGGSTEWLINIALSIMLTAWLIDWRNFIKILFTGTILGLVLGYSVLGDSNAIFKIINCNDFSSIYLLSYTFIFSFLIGLIFFRKKEADNIKKLSSLKVLTGAISQEVNNVISLQINSTNSLQSLFDKMKLTNKKNQDTDQLLLETDTKTYSLIKNEITKIGQNSQKSLAIIKRIVVNMTREIKGEEFEITSIKDCVLKSLEKYSMTPKQRKNIEIKITKDFKFKGSQYYLNHVIFNILKNAHKFCNKEDCKIKIWTKNNKLYLKDNGPGISKENLPYIFDYFYTTSTTSPGIGLSFSKLVMEKLGGNIYCQTQTGEKSFTTFILSFPKY